MANNTLITRITADTSQFNSKVNGAKSVLQQFGLGGKEAGWMVSMFDKILNTNIGTLGKLSVAVGAASSALKVAKDAFFKSESNIDEWGRSVEGAKAAYNTFLSALNSGNWTNFFSRLNDAINGARDLYDMFDRLGSMKTNNSVLIATLENKLAELRLMKQAGKDVTEQVNAINARLSSLRNQEVTQGKDANRQGFINTLTDKGISEKDAKTFWEYFKSHGHDAFNYFDKRAKELGKNYEYVSGFGGSSITGASTGGYNQWNGTSKELKEYESVSAFVNAESELKPFIEGYANAVKEGTSIMQSEFATNRWGGKANYGGGSGGGKGGGGSTIAQLSGKAAGLDLNLIPDTSIKGVEEKLAEAQALYKIAGDEAGRNYAKAMIEAYSNELEYLKGNNPMMEQINKDFAESMKRTKLPEMPNLEIPKEVTKNWHSAAGAIEQVGSALSGLEDPQAKVAGLIAQAIASIAMTFASSLKGTFTPWDWIAGAAAGTATMIATITSIKSATAGAYANGGVVGGNSYYGDKLYARVNSGETILNQEQSRRALEMMQPASATSSQSSVSLSGEMIKIVLNNHLRSIGVSGDKLIG